MNSRQSEASAGYYRSVYQTALPVGSKTARIRRIPRFLRHHSQCDDVSGEEGYLEQPHISGRAYSDSQKATARTCRNSCSRRITRRRSAPNSIRSKNSIFRRKRPRACSAEAVALLSHMIQNVSFATVPHRSEIYLFRALLMPCVSRNFWPIRVLSVVLWRY